MPTEPETGPTETAPGRHRRSGFRSPAIAAAVAVVLSIGVVATVRLAGSSSRTADGPTFAGSATPILPAAGPGTSSATAKPSASRSASVTPSGAKPSSSAPAARKAGPGGFPGPGNTGYLPGTKLKATGEMTITKAGTVVQNVFANCILVRASNVTVRNSLIKGGSCGSARQAETPDSGVHNVLFEDVEIDGNHVDARGAGIGGSGFTCRRCNIHGMARGVQPNNDVVIEDSYVHDLYGTGNSENAAFQCNGGSHLVVRGSNLEMNKVPVGGMAVALIGDWGVLDDILFEDNLFNGGGSYTVWGGDAASDKNPAYKARNTRFLNNAFGRKFYAKGGYYGPVAGWDGSMPGNKWSGNHWLDTGRSISA